MKKVMIVEDEPLTLVGIQSLIEWEQEGYELVATSPNGKDALEKIAKYEPDVVLTDLMMDTMNGFELIENALVEYPGIKFIVLSNYNDFDNVRRSMKLGAVDYIFKLTIKGDELLSVINEATKKMNINIETKNIKQPSSSSYVIQQNMSFNNIRVDSKSKMRILYLLSDNIFIMNKKVNQDNCQFLDFAINNIISELMYSQYIYDLFRYYDGMYVLVYNVKDENKDLQNIENIFDLLKQYIKSLFDLDMSGVISDVFINLDELKCKINNFNVIKENKFFSRQAQLDKEYNLIVKNDLVYSNKEIDDLNNVCKKIQEDILNLEFKEAKIKLESILEGKAMYTKKAININLLKKIYKALYIGFQHHKINIDEILNKDNINMEEAIVCYDYFENIKEEFIIFLDKYVLHHNENLIKPCRQEVIVTKKYVRENLEEDISVVKIASVLGMSESRFSHMFKDETGENFTEYVIGYKISIAIGLLRDTDMRIGEIGKKIGIDNQNYFSTQFKKKVGMSPAEYRKRIWLDK